MGLSYLCEKFTRRFALVVSGTQDQADEHVSSVGTTMERIGIRRSIGIYGQSKGWKRNQLRTANGFNVAAIGIDSALARGFKLDEFRPDLIVFDDVDNREDKPEAVKKKIRAITQTILPGGSSDCAVLVVQNLVHEDSIMAQLSEGTAEFLLNRIQSDVIPAVRGLEYESVMGPQGRNIYRITKGEPTWSGQSLAVCEAQMAEWGLPAFLREAQHQVHGGAGYFFNPDEILLIDPEEVPTDLKVVGRGWDLAATEGGGDFTAGIKIGIGRNGVGYILDISCDQLSTDRVKKRLMAKAQEDKAEHYNHKVRLRLAVDPGQAGIYQRDDLETFLKEFGPHFEFVTKNKATKAQGFAEQVNLGNMRIVRRPGDRIYDKVIQNYKRELRRFREDNEHDHDDQVDASAECWIGINEPPKNVSAPGVGAALNPEIEQYDPGRQANPFPRPGNQPGLNGAIIGEGYDPANQKV